MDRSALVFHEQSIFPPISRRQYSYKAEYLQYIKLCNIFFFSKIDFTSKCLCLIRILVQLIGFHFNQMLSL